MERKSKVMDKKSKAMEEYQLLQAAKAVREALGRAEYHKAMAEAETARAERLNIALRRELDKLAIKRGRFNEQDIRNPMAPAPVESQAQDS